MGVDLTIVYWSSSNQYERHSASTTHKNIGVKKWENKKAGVKKKAAVKKSGENPTKVGIEKMGVKKRGGEKKNWGEYNLKGKK